MTNEDAIANLNVIRVAFIDTVTAEQGKLIDDTFEIAIKALEQQPCEDAISQQGEKNISKGFEDFMIKSLQRQAESENCN